MRGGMHFISIALAAAAVIALVWHLLTRGTALPRGAPGSWGINGSDDPRVAAAAMLYAIAAEDGPPPAERELLIRTLLAQRLGLDRSVAKDCLIAGSRLDHRLRGNLNSRLHLLAQTIAVNCTSKEKNDVVEMLRDLAGPDRLGNVREAVGRVSATLLHG